MSAKYQMKTRYLPTKEELKVADEFIKLQEVRGMNLNEMLCHFASRNVARAFKYAHAEIVKMEESEDHTGLCMPISDLFENQVILQLQETL